MIEKAWLELHRDRLIEIRRWLHQHPELGFEEQETSEFIKELLRKAGYKIIQTDEMRTGFYCDYGSGETPILAIRCELDAIPLFDAKTVPYRSRNVGVMHACGHDVHMAITIGLALEMAENRPDFKGCVRFVFQPAEEKAPGGALAMIEGDAMEDVDHIIGFHVLPKLDTGKVGLRHGAMSAEVDVIDINLSGMGGHTSRPHQAVDLVAVAAQLVIALDEMILHRIDRQKPAVLSFGSIEGGETFNVIPSKINLRGTLRYLHQEMKQELHTLIGEIIHNIAQSTGAKIEWRVPYMAPGIRNEEAITNLLIEAIQSTLGTDRLVYLEKASLAGEDFAYYLESVPGTYFRIGSSDGYFTDLHSIMFDVNEDCIFVALQVLGEFLHRYFNFPAKDPMA